MWSSYKNDDEFCLFLQALYVFAVYFIMHNQVCWPTKASYTVEMGGHDGPDSTYQGGGPTNVGADISKSTQNLISAMEEVIKHSCTGDHKDCINLSSHGQWMNRRLLTSDFAFPFEDIKK